MSGGGVNTGFLNIGDIGFWGEFMWIWFIELLFKLLFELLFEYILLFELLFEFILLLEFILLWLLIDWALF